MIKIGNEINTFSVISKRVNKVMVHQHIRINANFVDIPVFIKAIAHENLHMILNEIVDRSCEVSLALDNIDKYVDNYPVSCFFIKFQTV